MIIFFFKQKTAYEITYGDWSSDVCSSDLPGRPERRGVGIDKAGGVGAHHRHVGDVQHARPPLVDPPRAGAELGEGPGPGEGRPGRTGVTGLETDEAGHEEISRISAGRASTHFLRSAARARSMTRTRPLAATTTRSRTPSITTGTPSLHTMQSPASCSTAGPTVTLPWRSRGRTRASASQVPMSSQSKCPGTTATASLRSSTPMSIE